MRDDDDITEVYTAGELETIPAENVENLNADSEEFLREFFNEHKEGMGEIRIYRQDGSMSDMVRLKTVPLDKFTYDGLLEFIQKHFNGGDYRLMIYTINEKGKLDLKTHRLVTIGNRIGENEPEIKPDFSGETNELLRQLLRETQQPKQATDWAGLLKTGAVVATAATPLIKLVLDALPERRDPFKEAMGKLKVYEKIKEIELLEKDSEPEKSMMDHFTEFLEVAKDLINENKNNLPAPVNQTEKFVGDVGQSYGPNPDPAYKNFAPFFEVLRAMAKEQPDIEEVIESIVPQFTPEQILLFDELVRMDDPMAFILKYDYEFVSYHAWISDFINELEAALPEPPSGSEGGTLNDTDPIGDNIGVQNDTGAQNENDSGNGDTPKSVGGDVIQ